MQILRLQKLTSYESLLNLLALPSAERRPQQFHPINYTEDLKLKLHCSSYKTLCLEGNYVKVRSRHKLNVLCIL